MDSSITSSLKPRKARHFLKAGAVASVTCFLFARKSPHQSESTKHIDALIMRESVLFAPPSSSGQNDEATHYRKQAESKGKMLRCRRTLCQEAFFFFFFFFFFFVVVVVVVVVAVSGCTWKSTGGVHAVCEVTIERYLAFKKLGFLGRQTTVFSFSSQVLFQTSGAQT